MDYSVQLCQSHFKESVEKGDDIQQRATRQILSSSFLQGNESALALVPAQACHVKGCLTHKHHSSHKMSQLFLNPSLIFYSITSFGYEFHMLRTDTYINNLNNHC